MTGVARGLVAALALAMAAAGCGARDRADRIVVGSKNFTEQDILGELLAQHLERRTGLKVKRRFHLGGTFVCHSAITSGEIDVYVEYTGTAHAAILKQTPISNTKAVYENVRGTYGEMFNLVWTEPLGFNNTFAILIRGEDARRLGLKTISDAAAHTANWRPGFGYEFIEREDGYPGLVEAYGLQFAATPRVMDLGLTYRALANGQVDLIAGNSTDAQIAALDLFHLEDDAGYFPPYQAAPVIRREVLERHPQVGAALAELAGTISDAEMRRLNYLVDVEHRDFAEVVTAWLADLSDRSAR